MLALAVLTAALFSHAAIMPARAGTWSSPNTTQACHHGNCEHETSPPTCALHCFINQPQATIPSLPLTFVFYVATLIAVFLAPLSIPKLSRAYAYASPPDLKRTQVLLTTKKRE